MLHVSRDACFSNLYNSRSIVLFFVDRDEGDRSNSLLLDDSSVNYEVKGPPSAGVAPFPSKKKLARLSAGGHHVARV